MILFSFVYGDKKKKTEQNKNLWNWKIEKLICELVNTKGKLQSRRELPPPPQIVFIHEAKFYSWNKKHLLKQFSLWKKCATTIDHVHMCEMNEETLQPRQVRKRCSFVAAYVWVTDWFLDQLIFWIFSLVHSSVHSVIHLLLLLSTF